jgi:hypothetical protein
LSPLFAYFAYFAVKKDAYFLIANTHFAMQSECMETDWAAEHLQTIRTLMERSAVYRRALAPIMVWTGLVGVIGGVVGWKLDLRVGAFVAFWSVAAIIAIVGSFVLVRRQALKDSEPFWSPPTRRIAQALLPPLFIGAFLNALVAYLAAGEKNTDVTILVILWLWLYGCAAYSAGFFVPRGMKLFGWIFILTGCVLVIALFGDWLNVSNSPCLLMTATFGGLHLAYGIYLYVTEKGKNAA